ncbi:MAG: diguanylate cyclase [Pseudomonadota bacterium]|nr:diguanylate cyclase [Pseudomonadota bacterium]
MGIAVCPQHGANAESLVSNASAAMYEAKRNGSGDSFALLV